MSEIKIVGNLDEDVERDRIILRGKLDPSSMLNLKVDWYQRSANFSAAKTRRLVASFATGDGHMFPDITLGMRGHRWQSEEDVFILEDPTYIIDGLQRWSAAGIARELARENEGRDLVVSMGAKLYFDTDPKFERDLFKALNTGHTSTAPSVLLRNEKEDIPLIGMLYGLTTNDQAFAMKDRVSWDQAIDRTKGGHLLRASTVFKIMTILHTHKIRRSVSSGSLLDIAGSVASRVHLIGGLGPLRQNVTEFFDFIDDVWGLRDPSLKFGTTHLSTCWLRTVAKILSDHRDFWKEGGTLLNVSASQRRDFRKIDPADEEMSRLTGRDTEMNRDFLYQHMVRRLNHGKVRANHLKGHINLADDEEQVSA